MKMIEDLIVQKMAQSHVPGLTFSYVEDGNIIYQRCFGTKNRENNFPIKDPVTPETCFEIGSCTKSITGLAIMQLQEQDKLNVNDPVKDYLEWFELGSKTNPITIHHLLSHSSGIPSLDSATVSISGALNEDKDTPMIPLATMEDYHYWINNAKSEIKFNPGERYFYCNDGYNLLGMIISKVSGEPYEEYVRNHILKPLGMNRSFFMSEKPPKDGNIAIHYQIKEKNLIPAPRTVDIINNPAGGLVCSSNDLIKYMTMVMNGGKFTDSKLVNHESIKQQTTIHIKNDYSIGSINPIKGDEGYAYGWRVAHDFFGHDLVQHSGGTGVCSTNIILVPELKIGLFGSNNTNIDFSPYFMAGLMLLMGKNPQEELKAFKIMEIQNEIAGEYQSYQGLNKTIIKAPGNGVLIAKIPDMPIDMWLIPDERDPTYMTYFAHVMPGVKYIVRAFKDKNGKLHATYERNLVHKVK